MESSASVWVVSTQLNHPHTQEGMWVTLLAVLANAVAAAPMNLLYMLVDDLRPELGAYGVPSGDTAGSPRLDELAADALTFERAYCQQVRPQPQLVSQRPAARHHQDVHIPELVPRRGRELDEPARLPQEQGV